MGDEKENADEEIVETSTKEYEFGSAKKGAVECIEWIGHRYKEQMQRCTCNHSHMAIALGASTLVVMIFHFCYNVCLLKKKMVSADSSY